MKEKKVRTPELDVVRAWWSFFCGYYSDMPVKDPRKEKQTVVRPGEFSQRVMRTKKGIIPAPDAIIDMLSKVGFDFAIHVKPPMFDYVKIIDGQFKSDHVMKIHNLVLFGAGDPMFEILGADRENAHIPNIPHSFKVAVRYCKPIFNHEVVEKAE